MFVQCIVGSEVVRLAEGMPVKGAMLRDVVIYIVSVVGVLVFLAYGQVGRPLGHKARLWSSSPRGGSDLEEHPRI
jgi:hypothetical protein